MTGTAVPHRTSRRASAAILASGPALLFGVRLSAAVSLALLVAFWLQLDNPSWAGTSAAIVTQPVLGASLRKGLFRLVGTVVGAVAAVALTAIVPQDRFAFLLCVALWCGACSFVSTVLRNFASYAAMLAGYTLVIIASSSILAPDQVFLLAVSRATEIAIGIVCGMGVMALTAFGDTPQRMAGSIRDIAAEAVTGLRVELAEAGPRARDSRPIRRALVARVIALDPMLDQAVGESAAVGARRSIARAGVQGLYLVLSAWRTISAHLRALPDDEARRLARMMYEALPPDPSAEVRTDRELPVDVRDRWLAAAEAARAMPATTGSTRLGLDRIGTVCDGLGRALNAIVLLGDIRQAIPFKDAAPLMVPDILPPLVNAARVFIAIVAASLLVIGTAWSVGYTFLTFVAVTVLLLSPLNEQAGRAIVGFGIGTILAVGMAAVTVFALLPNHEGFTSFALVISLVLVPLAALSTRPALAGALVPATMNFVPLLGPTNEIRFDIVSFANAALAIAGGCLGGAVILLVIPPIPIKTRTQRLMALTLLDLRGAMRYPGRLSPNRWRQRVYGRLAALPPSSDPADGTRLLAALTVGLQMMSLRADAAGLALPIAPIDRAGAALARGEVAAVESALAALPVAAVDGASAQHLRVMAARREVVETARYHADYFQAECR